MAEKKKKDEVAEEAPVETEEQVEAVIEEKPEPKAKAPKKAKSEAVASDSDGEAKQVHKRAEKVGVVFSDKMTKTVVVRVDRTVKHPLYRKYMKKRGKFMAHNELGAAEGDRVRIVETRPLSARKRWRVVEIIQKAQK
jgi:small subunit ribosomal protein S17